MKKRRDSIQILDTPNKVIDALGGNPGVSELTGVRAKIVSDWRRSDALPSRFYLVFSRALRRKRLSAPPAVLGQVTLERNAA